MQIDPEVGAHSVTRIETISSGCIDLDRVGYVDSGESIDRYRLRDGDLLFSHINSMSMIGNCAIYEGGPTLHVGMNLLRIRPSGSVSSKFLFYSFCSKIGRHQVRSFAKPAINQASISTSSLKRILLPLPDHETQKAIADFLDRETARIDQLIEKKQRFLEMADERWRATLNHVVFPNSPNWERLPDGWRKVRLKYLTDPKRPIMYGIVLPGPNMDEGPMIVKGGDVKPGRLHPDRLCRTTKEIEAGYVRSRLKAGDLVISIRGGIGDIEIVPPEIEGANLTQDAARIAPRSGVDREWLRYTLLSSAVFHPLEARSLGAAVRGINIFDLKRVFVPEPPKPVQADIARLLKQQEGRLANLRAKVVMHSERLREFRAALITAAVTGQIDVATWGKRGDTDRRLDRIEEAMRA